jgi:hypothetical protein
MEKIFTQAAFAVILLVLATLPVVTYGCLKLREPPATTAPGGGTVSGQTPGPTQDK